MGPATSKPFNDRREETLDMAVAELGGSLQHQERIRAKIADIYASHFNMRREVALMID